MSGGEAATLPKGWSVAWLRDVADINPTLNKSVYSDSLEVSFVPMPAVEAETGVINVSDLRRFSTVKKGYTPFCEGDVLFAKITPCMENGKMAIVPAVKNGLAFGSTEFHVLRPYPGISAAYVYYFVSAQRFRFDAEHKMTGAVGQRRVPAAYLENHAIPVAPTKAQERIVAKIDELFSELSKGVESLKTAREQLRVYRQAVLKHAFEGKLTAQWRERSKDKLESANQLLAHIRKERGDQYEQLLAEWKAVAKKWETNGRKGKKPSKPRDLKSLSTLADGLRANLPDIPDNWVWEKLGYMTCGVEYGTGAKSLKSGSVPVIRMGNLQNGVIDWQDLAFTSDKAEIAKYSLNPGDVLFNRTNSPELVGKSAIYRGERPALFAGYLIRVNQIETLVNSQYLNLFLGSHIARQHGNTVKTDGVNQSNINGEKLQSYPFPYCCLPEQCEVVRILDEKLSLTDQLLQEIETQLTKSNAFRQSILRKAFAGQLVAQDPKDEPASVLLERIKAGKEDHDKNNKSNKSVKMKDAA